MFGSANIIRDSLILRKTGAYWISEIICAGWIVARIA
jgi:hypothetical protein